MRKLFTSVFTWLVLSLAVFPIHAALADQWNYPDTIGHDTTFTYNVQSSVNGGLTGSIQAAMNGWNGISANHWHSPLQLATNNSNPGAPGQIQEIYSGWGHSQGYAGYTTAPSTGGNGIINGITTQLNSDPNGCGGAGFTFNTGTITSGCSISTQDLFVHELGFVVSLNEGCFGANGPFGTPADTVQNSVMCDSTLSQNHPNPQSNDSPAVVYIYH